MKYEKQEKINQAVNVILGRELAGFRFVDGMFTDITDDKEIELLQEALKDTEFPGVKGHLKTALSHLSNRESPDYRNSIKESISAVESMAQVITAPCANIHETL